MKLYKIFTAFSLFSFLLSIGCKEPADLGGCVFPEDLEKNYSMVWNDEFDGSAIDDNKWSFDLGDGCDINLCGWGNNELEYYTNRPENAYLSNGNLVIKAIKESPLYLGKYQYTSSRMVTKNKGDWKYGRMDIRAKIPVQQGVWPAIWMLPTENVYGGWPRSGEIDIMEQFGREPRRVEGTIHYGHDYWRYIGDHYELEQGSFADNFHVYSVQWSEDCIEFLMDGIPYSGPYTRSTTLPTTWPFDQKFHMLINVAVGGNAPGNPPPSTPFPQILEVDYVRVYQPK